MIELISAMLLGASALQPMIDAAAEGTTVMVPAGDYLGPVRVTKRLTLDGQSHATIRGTGHGTVVSLEAAGIVFKGFTVSGSGSSHDGLDAAIVVKGDDVRVEHNVVTDALFGVLLSESNRGLVCGNTITSKADEPGLRGDAVRVWSGGFNRVVGNDIQAARDVSLANSPNNTVEGNVIRAGRTGVHLVFSPRAHIDHNLLDENLTGVVILYSNDVTLSENHIQHSRGNAGTGLAFKDSSRALVSNNAFIHCGTGVKLNAPTSPDNIVTFTDNLFAHNIAAMDFYGENGGHVLKHNHFRNNLSQVTVSAPMSARGNLWSSNTWDTYLGFDTDADGVGDVPHEQYFFADRIWMEEPMATFFRNSPAFELIDLLERLAPFASPELVLRDPQPATNTTTDATPWSMPLVPACPSE